MRYLVREKIFAIGDDFWVTDEQGNQVYLVDGKAMRLRETFELKDSSGQVVAVIRKKLLSLHDGMNIERDGQVIATVKKALFSPLHHRSTVELAGGGQLEAVGNILDKEFEIRWNGSLLAQISRSWFRMRDTYGVDIAPGQDDALILAVAVCLDRIHHDEQEAHRDR
ncbi:MAG TPA: LURP-one-related family protein [Streptosporangiaceae bacterium]|nr:LURP-one-related family protein [Streptosporangiaceae bacterium]